MAGANRIHVHSAMQHKRKPVRMYTSKQDKFGNINHVQCSLAINYIFKIVNLSSAAWTTINSMRQLHKLFAFALSIT